MALISLQIENFRCVSRAELTIDPHCTVITGQNAAGKTSILEAIYVLSSGRSFRTRRNELLLRDGGPGEFLIAAKVAQRHMVQTMGLRWSPTSRDLRLNGLQCRGFGEIAAALPVQVIDPGAHRLLEDGPAFRRRFLDWGVFHVERGFVEAWRTYHAALSQRNAALKTQQPPNLIRNWDDQLVTAGEQISAHRDSYLRGLEVLVRQFSTELIGSPIAAELRRGWDRDLSFAQALDANWPRDLRYRATTVGPHRADLHIQLEGMVAKDRVSRGQQKLLACALVLAQLQHLVDCGLDEGCLLLDDPAAELDVNNLGKFLGLAARIPVQLIVTAVDANTIEPVKPGNKFHVEQGRVAQVV